ncbi:MAG: MFS transporter, partial [Deltaproteobacteria bacterium]|nr:MFS transporter [Deltaproteobacteria bacterium]
QTREPGERLFRSLASALGFIWRRRGIFYIAVLAGFKNFVINPVYILLPLLVTQHFGGGALHLGWLQSGTGVGLIAGGLILSAWGGFKRKVVTMHVGNALQGLSLVMLGLTPSTLFPLAVVAMVANGTLNAFYNGPIAPLLQTAVPPDMQGRVFTLYTSICQGGYLLSLAFVGPIVGLIGLRTWYVGGGLIVFAVCIMSLFVPSIAHLEANVASEREAESAASEG